MRKYSLLLIAVKLATVSVAIEQANQAPSWFICADGLNDAGELPQYVRAGMNIVWVSVSHRPDGDFRLQDELIDASDREGLPFILALDLCPSPKMRFNFLCSPYDRRYIQWLHQWLDTVIPHFRKRRNLLGYALGQQVDEAVSYDDFGFVSFLQTRYKNLENLSKAWGIPVGSWQHISQITAMQSDDNLSQIRYSRPSLDVALYRWQTLRTLLTLWAQEVRSRDDNPNHLLIAGPLTTYRSLAVVPPKYQIVIPFLSPERAEPDFLTHNVHSVSIARRAGRFKVIPMLTMKIGGKPIQPSTLARWISSAVAQGASGFLFNDWQTFHEQKDLQVLIATFTRRLQVDLPDETQPVPKSAILYTPFGEGVLDVQGFPLYGFAQPQANNSAYPLRLSLDEPAPLFFGLRFHRWGITDCLTPEDLSQQFIRRYGVIFAPMPTYLDEAMQLELIKFVSSGGVLVSDFGVGAFQSEQPFLSLPQILQQLFGVITLRRILFGDQLRVNMVVAQRHPLFPTIIEGTELGSPFGAFPFIVGLTPAFTAQPWAVLTMARFGRRGKTAGRMELAGVFVNNYGHGYAIFVPTLLWALWSPKDIGFSDFHGSLIARRSQLFINDEKFSPSVWISEMNSGIFVVNPEEKQQIVKLRLRSPSFLVYSNSTTHPIATSPFVEELETVVPPNDWVFLSPVAQVTPPVKTKVLEATPDKIHLTVKTEENVSPVTLKIFYALYRSGDTLHTVTISAKGEKEKRKVQPDRWGEITLTDIPVPSEVIITPEN